MAGTPQTQMTIARFTVTTTASDSSNGNDTKEITAVTAMNERERERERERQRQRQRQTDRQTDRQTETDP